MKSLILAFVLALVVGIGGASAAAVVKARRAAAAPHVVADTTRPPHADSTALRVIEASGVSVASAAAKPAHDTVSAAVHADTLGETGSAPRHTPLASAPVGAAGTAEPAATPSPAAKPTVGAVTSGEVPPGERRVSRVFASMAPREAAKVLEQMSDADVAIILGNLQEKKVAAILAQLPAPRVASISRGVLRPVSGAK